MCEVASGHHVSGVAVSSGVTWLGLGLANPNPNPNPNPNQAAGGMIVAETGKPRTSGGVYLQLLKQASHLPREVHTHVEDKAAQRPRPTRPPARAASARSCSGRPPASASLGQPADWHLFRVRKPGLFSAQAQAAALRRIKQEGKKVKSSQKGKVSGWYN